MGITKQYLRFVAEASFGVVGSSNAESFFVKYAKTNDRYVVAAACEDVILWDSRLGNQVMRLRGEKHSVSCLVAHPTEESLTVGYADGSIRCFTLKKGACTLGFNGHKAAVTCLAYDNSGMRLASGGKDTEIVIWDVINEAGIFRLKGHKGVVTCCGFLKDRNMLISSSKDTLIKFWDLDTQHCFKTLVGHRTEIWSFVILEKSSRLITGSADSELRVYDMKFEDQQESLEEKEEPDAKKSKLKLDSENVELEDEDDDMSVLSCKKIGTILRQGRERVHSLKVDQTERILACHGSDSLLEIFQILNEEERKKRLSRKQRKERKKQENPELETEETPDADLTLSDEIKRLAPLKGSGKIRAFDLVVKNQNKGKVLLLLNNNSLEFFDIQVFDRTPNFEESSFIRIPGHRTDVRTVAFSSDAFTLLSGSGESIKIWNSSSQQCIRTMPCDYALTSIFAPGDKHCVIGTKSGKLQIFDISSGELLDSIDAHQEEIWSIALASDMRGIVSGSADKDVKFWDFELIKNEESPDAQKRLTLTHQRTLKMTENVLCVRISKDMRLLAVSLLDSTVKVFFVDTLKFFLSLYGHKFPVLCMDISDDGTLIITGSADKNIKIWGLDFGDCHKSIFAHEESIMCLQFIPRTHMFFSGSKDKKIKQWDADNFQKITTLEGHQGEIWALAVSPGGKELITASHDKSLRLWEKTDEPLVLEEEQEMEREAEFEKSAIGDEPVIPGETNKETGMAGKKSIETIAAAEKLIEGIDIYNEQTAILEEYKTECQSSEKEIPPPKANPLMEIFNTTCPIRYMLEVVRRIKSSELEEALLVLPFTYVSDLLYILSLFLDRNWETELSCRCLFFMLRVHCNQIMATQSLIPVIEKLRKTSISAVNKLRDMIGFNLSGLQYLQRELDANEVVLFADATQKLKEKKKRNRRKEKMILHIE